MNIVGGVGWVMTAFLVSACGNATAPADVPPTCGAATTATSSTAPNISGVTISPSTYPKDTTSATINYSITAEDSQGDFVGGTVEIYYAITSTVSEYPSGAITETTGWMRVVPITSTTPSGGGATIAGTVVGDSLNGKTGLAAFTVTVTDGAGHRSTAYNACFTQT